MLEVDRRIAVGRRKHRTDLVGSQDKLHRLGMDMDIGMGCGRHGVHGACLGSHRERPIGPTDAASFLPVDEWTRIWRILGRIRNGRNKSSRPNLAFMRLVCHSRLYGFIVA